MTTKDERRSHPRAEVNWLATMITSAGPMEVVAQNVSLVGAFVRCSEVPDLDDTFRLMIKPPQGRLLLATGTKIWSDSFIGDESTFHGVGVRFLYFYHDDREALSEMISDLVE